MLKDEPKTPTVYIFCPPQLHLNLGMAVHFVQAVERLDSDMCAEWEDELGVSRDEKHGDARTLCFFLAICSGFGALLDIVAASTVFAWVSLAFSRF